MKLSEIFRRPATRESDASLRETIEKRPALKTSTTEKIGEIETLEESVPFEPPRPPLPAGYVYPDATESANLHAELLRELPENHALFGVPLETFAACEGNDDTLFRFRGNPTRYVLVHLTWLGRTEIDADHPGVVFIGTFEEFLQREKFIYNTL